MPPGYRRPRRPSRPLGRRPADPARLARTVRLKLTGAVPDHPLVADHLSRVPVWNGATNMAYGTCGPVAVANSAIITWKYLLGEDITVADDDIFDLYRRSGNPDFDPGSGQGDNGVDMTVMYAELVRGGLWITHPAGTRELAKPLCFAAHDTGIEAVHAVTSIFGCDQFGLDLDVAQSDQTDTGLWDYVPGSPAWGGHATAGGAYTSSAAAHTRDESLVTWELVVGTTDLFLARQLAEAYVVVWPALWVTPAFQAGVDQAALAADYQQMTGRPFPVPVPPQPPGPPPSPDIRVDTADLGLVAGLPHGWDTARHCGANKKAAAAVRAWKHAKGIT